MDPISLALLGITVGAWLGLWSWGTDVLKAQKEKDRLTAAAEEDARDARDAAAGALEDALGQLATDFSTYDDWYKAQQDEYDSKVADGSYGGSFQEYLRSQQTSELGQYGLQRAELELNVQIAEQRLDQTTRDIAAIYSFGERKYDEGVIASNRILRNETAAVVAGGVRGGTGFSTVAENQRVRGEELQVFLDQLVHERDLGLERVATASAELAGNEEIGYGRLAQGLVSTRRGYSDALKDINRELRQYKDTMNTEFLDAYGGSSSAPSWAQPLLGAGKAMVVGGATGAKVAFSTASIAADVGLITFDDIGTFKINWEALGLPLQIDYPSG